MSKAINPVTLFKEWYASAKQSQPEADAMALATTGKNGMPSVRMVLLKQCDDDGFVFYTNLNSFKASQILENPCVACCFYWQSIEKQVRIEGSVISVSSTEADAYFQTRERESQISSWASHQSQKLECYEDLLANIKKYEKQFHGIPVPRPPYWSGLRIKPRKMEFWEAGPSRLHKRTVYQKMDTRWETFMLNP